jgi:hypothetical protein
VRCDTELELKGDRHIRLSTTKQKDERELPTLHLDRIDVGDSCVLVSGEAARGHEGLNEGDLATLEVLRNIQIPGGVPSGAWEKADGSKRSFWDHRRKLLEYGKVVNVGTESRPKWMVAEGA